MELDPRTPDYGLPGCSRGMADGLAYVTAGTNATGDSRGICGVGRCDPEAERSDSVLRLGQCDGGSRGIPAG